MAKAKKPVSVAGIEFDALISSEESLESTVPEYAVEKGYNVSDNIMLKSETLSMVLYLTDYPVTWYGRHNGGKDRVKTVISQLRSLYYTKEPVTVVTSERTYTDMAIEAITISKSIETGYAREIPINFRKIRTTKAKTTTIPDSYGKSGATAAPAGTASTSSGNAPTVAAPVAAGPSSGGSSSESPSKGSILYNASKSLGWL